MGLWSRYTRDELVRELDEVIKHLPEGAVNPTFGLEEWCEQYEHDSRTYMTIRYELPETDEEMNARIEQEAKRILTKEHSDKLLYEALKKQFEK